MFASWPKVSKTRSVISIVESLDAILSGRNCHQAQTSNCKCGDYKPRPEIGSPGSKHNHSGDTYPWHGYSDNPSHSDIQVGHLVLETIACLPILNEIVLKSVVYLFGCVGITHHILGPFASFKHHVLGPFASSTLGRCFQFFHLLFIWTFSFLRRIIGWCGCGLSGGCRMIRKYGFLLPCSFSRHGF